MSYRGIGQTSESAVTGTAAWLASLCAIFSKDPDYAAILDDPFAIPFAEAISPEAPAALARFDDFKTRREFIIGKEGKHPGHTTVVLYRKPLMQKLAVEALSETGARQLVVLGAGCDTLSLRLARRGIRPAVFEIDRPPVIQFRQSAMASLAVDTAHIHGVSVDFDRQRFEDVLVDSGFAGGEPSVFFAEGLLGYLLPESVDAIFRFIREQAGPASQFVFSFTERRRADAKDRVGFQDVLDRQGEPPQFDLPPDEVEGFLSARGFALTRLMTARDIKRDVVPRYKVPIGIIPYMHLAVAKVL